MKMFKCWEVFKCDKKGCPAYKSSNLKCWLLSGTQCRDEIKATFLEKIEICFDCEIFKVNMDANAIRETILVLNEQLKEARKAEKKLHEKIIEYEKFDYNIIKTDINPFADTLVNEIWPFLRMLWRTRGGYEAEILFCPELDLLEFGSQFGPAMYNANIKFKINDDGVWTADFHYKFDQIDNPDDDRERPPLGRKGAFYAQDYSRMKSNTAARARNLARPDWGTDGRDGQDFADLLDEETLLNKTIDFSFSHRYQGSGDWGNFAEYEVAVPSSTTVVIPEKEAMLASEVSTISLSSIKRATT